MQSIIVNLLSDIFTVQRDTFLGRLMPWFAGGIVAFVAFPWVMMVLYGLYFGIFLRPKEQAAMSLSPLLTFLYFLTDEATPGFDQRLMRLFHPSLLEEEKDGGSVQRGLIRAMSRCLIDKFGKVANIPRDTVVLKREGNDVNCMALVDFEKVKQVRCQLSWKRRPGVVKRYREKTGRYPARSEKESFVLNGIGIAFPYTFQVTSFHIDPKKGDEFNILKYVRLVDFDDFGELFVRRLFEKPPRAAVSMMVQSLKEKYSSGEALATLQDSVQKVVDACGGLASSLGSLTVEQTSYKAVYAPVPEEAEPLPGEPQTENEDGRKAPAIDGVDMEYLVEGITRNVEAYLRLTFSGLKALVTRYELRLLPDELAQVVVDHDTGKSIIVG
ncbi:conserved hypothetical protein [Leishmania infantum JPCM5]|uniref:Uncharacterized protein n=3 Tax=Leishmania donovani species complex TaxID=38574 RepID=A4I1Q2_LEIIN|nr:conserved hypothetical protein [Leishmania infantum JPCM5]XP_003861542.1 hypothetical protein, conserved [Leishmania donovani]CAC9495003.1 hypothetical_protein_-_conserved [Leishmania infantum]AYU79549.1 hypothetical protein LdCL_250027000 [Leishmania donovani]TPP40810.1 hypothetical protein CGC21_9040 [Leishmania donovani]CAM68682.1 conserved hypothetical protein [Leishmania infantum JPCM5]CBZ34842.1 hypothetical protein, conserved [Leishmania donovani]|eukprot:XP_001466243.1 conserved hypothetical protein [Leishmania infantum JPCM5]